VASHSRPAASAERDDGAGRGGAAFLAQLGLVAPPAPVVEQGTVQPAMADGRGPPALLPPVVGGGAAHKRIQPISAPDHGAKRARVDSDLVKERREAFSELLMGVLDPDLGEQREVIVDALV
jgi:hypothetical protein